MSGPDFHAEALERLYLSVDEEVRRLEEIHATRLSCGLGCVACCIDDLTVFSVEAENIRSHHGAMLETAPPGPIGACALLDSRGRCRIYDHRPYVCRTQGLPLRWLDKDDDGNTVELRDICPLNEAGAPVEELPEEHCWTLGPFEERLAALQYAYRGAQVERVSLRSLFANGRPAATDHPQFDV